MRTVAVIDAGACRGSMDAPDHTVLEINVALNARCNDVTHPSTVADLTVRAAIAPADYPPLVHGRLPDSIRLLDMPLGEPATSDPTTLRLLEYTYRGCQCSSCRTAPPPSRVASG
ncbi:MAG: hypothetical protein IPM29_26950 [Planctomycetes bacterium]|nr:hypothetical protein [Planctomycetota bacterium]